VERQDDIPLLCQHFLRKFAEAQGKAVNQIAPEVMEALLNYEFPGNIRELENIMERAVTLSAGKFIEMPHLPLDFQRPHMFQVQRHQKREFRTLEENEKEYISWVVKQVNGNKTKAAEVLGIDRVSLWRKLKRYDLNGGT